MHEIRLISNPNFMPTDRLRDELFNTDMFDDNKDPVVELPSEDRKEEIYEAIPACYDKDTINLVPNLSYPKHRICVTYSIYQIRFSSKIEIYFNKYRIYNNVEITDRRKAFITTMRTWISDKSLSKNKREKLELIKAVKSHLTK